MKKKTTYSITTTGNYVKVFINGILHLSFKYNEFIGLQAWKTSTDWYCLEIYTESKDILCEYDSLAKWTSIINLLNTAII